MISKRHRISAIFTVMLLMLVTVGLSGYKFDVTQ